MRTAALILMAALPLAAQMTVVGESAGGASDLNGLTDVTITSAADGDGLRHNGTAFVNTALFTAGTSDILAARMSANVRTAVGGGLSLANCIVYNKAGVLSCVDESFGIIDINVGGGIPAIEFDSKVSINEDRLYLRSQYDLRFSSSTGNMNTGPYVTLTGDGASIAIENNGGNSLASFGGSQTALFQDTTATTGITSVIVKGGDGQSTTPVFKINNYTDVPIVSIGDDVSSDIEIGYNAGANLTANTYNVLIGSGVFDNAASNGSNYNVMIGQNAGGVTSAANLVSNVLIGRNAGQAVAGSRNIMLGESAGLASTGSENVMIGRNTGGETTGGSNNIFLGSHAGRDETGSNTLIIDTIDRTSEALGRTGALLYGTMNATASSQTLHMNAAVRATQSLEVGNVGALIYPPSATEPVDCTTSNDGSMYFDTTDQKMCICANDGTDDEWLMSDNYSHLTGHCSL